MNIQLDFFRTMNKLIESGNHIGIYTSTEDGVECQVLAYDLGAPAPSITVLDDEGDTILFFINHIVSINYGKVDDEETS